MVYEKNSMGPYHLAWLAALLPFGAAASVGEEIVLEADFTGPLDTAYWQTTPNAFPEGKYIGTSQNPLSIRARTAPEGKSTLEISLLSDSSQNQDKNNWMTTYIGVRLSAASNMPTGADSGIFIAVNNKKIGMRQGNWPETGSFAINYDFSKTRTLTIIDDADKNEISIYADDDSGKKQLAATIEIVDGAP